MRFEKKSHCHKLAVLWTLADHLGTIRDIADQNESTYTTTVTNHRVFNAFGSLTSETNSAVDEVFGFTGRMLDDVTILQNNLNRWYDSNLGVIGRFNCSQWRAI